MIGEIYLKSVCAINYAGGVLLSCFVDALLTVIVEHLKEKKARVVKML